MGKKLNYEWLHTGPGIYFLVQLDTDENLAVICSEETKWTAYIEKTGEGLEPDVEGKGPKETASIAKKVCAHLGIPDIPVYKD